MERTDGSARVVAPSRERKSRCQSALMLSLQGEDFSVQDDAEIAIRVIAFTQKSFGLDSKFVFQPNLANISPELWRIKATSENDLRDPFRRREVNLD